MEKTKWIFLSQSMIMVEGGNPDTNALNGMTRKKCTKVVIEALYK